MEPVFFHFRLEVPVDVQEALLSDIASWHTVSKVGRINPGTNQRDLARMCCAYASRDEDIDEIITQLSGIAEIELAFLPAERRLDLKVAPLAKMQPNGGESDRRAIGTCQILVALRRAERSIRPIT